MEFITEVRIAEFIAVAIVVLSSLNGYRKGLLKSLFDMVRLVLVTVISIFFAPIIIGFIPQNVLMRHGIAYVASFVMAGLLLGVVSHVLGIVNYIPVVKQINRVAGGLTGLAIGFVILWIAFIIVGTFQSLEWCAFVASLVKESKVLMFIQGLNPIPEILNILNFQHQYIKGGR